MDRFCCTENSRRRRQQTRPEQIAQSSRGSYRQRHNSLAFSFGGGFPVGASSQNKFFLIAKDLYSLDGQRVGRLSGDAGPNTVQVVIDNPYYDEASIGKLAPDGGPEVLLTDGDALAAAEDAFANHQTINRQRGARRQVPEYFRSGRQSHDADRGNAHSPDFLHQVGNRTQRSNSVESNVSLGEVDFSRPAVEAAIKDERQVQMQHAAASSGRTSSAAPQVNNMNANKARPYQQDHEESSALMEEFYLPGEASDDDGELIDFYANDNKKHIDISLA